MQALGEIHLRMSPRIPDRDQISAILKPVITLGGDDSSRGQISWLIFRYQDFETVEGFSSNGLESR